MNIANSDGVVSFDIKEKKAKFLIKLPVYEKKIPVIISQQQMYIDVGVLGVFFERN